MTKRTIGPDSQRVTGRQPGQMKHLEFDAAFYRRFYLHTPVAEKHETERRARLLAAIVDELELPVARIVDMGCGLGWFRRPLLKSFPQATYTGVEYSEYLCSKHGWHQGSAASYGGRGRYDLVVCNDVLQYLSDADVAKALNNFARLCRGALYLHVPTTKDFRDVVDRAASDVQVHIRSAAWYRQRLSKNFIHTGNGVHVRRGVPFSQWELQTPWR